MHEQSMDRIGSDRINLALAGGVLVVRQELATHAKLACPRSCPNGCGAFECEALMPAVRAYHDGHPMIAMAWLIFFYVFVFFFHEL